MYTTNLKELRQNPKEKELHKTVSTSYKPALDELLGHYVLSLQVCLVFSNSNC